MVSVAILGVKSVKFNVPDPDNTTSGPLSNNTILNIDEGIGVGVAVGVGVGVGVAVGVGVGVAVGVGVGVAVGVGVGVAVGVGVGVAVGVGVGVDGVKQFGHQKSNKLNLSLRILKLCCTCELLNGSVYILNCDNAPIKVPPKFCSIRI